MALCSMSSPPSLLNISLSVALMAEKAGNNFMEKVIMQTQSFIFLPQKLLISFDSFEFPAFRMELKLQATIIERSTTK